MQKKNQFIGYLKFTGPSVNNGEMNAGKMGRSLISLDKTFKKYLKKFTEYEKGSVDLKVNDIKKGSTTVQVIIENIAPLVDTATNIGIAYTAADLSGIKEFGKKFFGTIGTQLALKIFAKGKKLKEEKKYAKDNEIYIKLTNNDKEEKNIPLNEWTKYKELHEESKGIVQLESNEQLTIGYKTGESDTDILTISHKDKQYTENYFSENIESQNSDPFNEEVAIDQKIIGKFIDFYGLAHKYQFAFQARKNQEEIGKQKILCMVEDEDVSKIINYLKPENNKNICISGLSILDIEGKTEKIKIKWFSEDLKFNPLQSTIL